MGESKNFMMQDDYLYLEAYQHELQGILNQDSGIKGLTQIATIPNGKVAAEVQPLWGALCEFVLFIECVCRPFFVILRHNLGPKRTCCLFSKLLKNINPSDIPMTAEEAFDFLCSLDHGYEFYARVHIRDILDVYKCFPTYAYNGIKNAIEKEDSDEFCKNLCDKERDYQDFMRALYKLRNILRYITIYDRRKRLEPQWVYHCIPLFYSIQEDVKSAIVEDIVKDYIVGRNRIERKAYKLRVKNLSEGDLQKLYSIKTTVDGRYYPDWIEKYTRMVNQSEFKTYLADLINNEEYIIDSSRYYSGFILKRAVIEHCSELIEHYSFKNPLEEVLQDDENFSPYEYDFDVNILGDYIILSTKNMIDILGEVEDVVVDEVKKILQWILECSRYTRLFGNMPTKNDKGTSELPPYVPNVDDPSNNSSKNLKYPINNDICTDSVKQNLLIKNYLHEWFDDGILRQEELRYVFFGEGTKPNLPLKFIGKKKSLLFVFIRYINKGHGGQEVWDYFKKNIVGDNKFWPQNPYSNTSNLYDKEKEKLDRILQQCPKKKV